MYALEIQSLIESNSETDILELQEDYNITSDNAQTIIETCCRKYLNQIFNFLLKETKKYNEKEVLIWLKEIFKYIKFVSKPIDCDGNVFTNDDKLRLLNYFDNNRSYFTENNNENENEDYLQKLDYIINLTQSYQPAVGGIAGLMNELPDMKVIAEEDTAANKKRWAWG